MNTKFNVGDKVSICGTVSSIEIYGQNNCYRFLENPDILVRECYLKKEPQQLVEVSAYAESNIKKKLEEYVSLLKKAQAIVESLRTVDMSLNLSTDIKGERVTTEFASIHTGPDSD